MADIPSHVCGHVFFKAVGRCPSQKWSNKSSDCVEQETVSDMLVFTVFCIPKRHCCCCFFLFLVVVVVVVVAACLGNPGSQFLSVEFPTDIRDPKPRRS